MPVIHLMIIAFAGTSLQLVKATFTVQKKWPAMNRGRGGSRQGSATQRFCTRWLICAHSRKGNAIFNLKPYQQNKKGLGGAHCTRSGHVTKTDRLYITHEVAVS